MARKNSIYNKMKHAFKALDISVHKKGILYEFEYEHFMFLLFADDINQTFTFVCWVIDSTDGGLTQDNFKTAVDIVKDSYGKYSGNWNGGRAYFSSPVNSLKKVDSISTEELSRQLKEFYAAYLFLETNMFLLADKSIWGYTE